MPQLVWTAKPDGTIEYLNQRWVNYTGVDLRELRRGRGNVGLIHPDELSETRRLWKAALKTGEPYEQEYRLRRASDGSYRWFLGRAEPIRGEDGTILRWIGTATDIDDRRHASENLRFILEIGDTLAGSHDIESLCNGVAQTAVGYIADWCFVTLTVEGELRTVAIEHKNGALREYLGQYRDRYPPRSDGILGSVVSQNKAFLAERVSHEQLVRAAAAYDAEYLRLLQLLQMHSVMIVPLSGSDGKVLGAISMVSSESGRLFSKTDLEVAKAVAQRMAVAIQNARIFEDQKRSAQELRLGGRINQLLFETDDPWQAMERIARVIATELADACAILRLDGNNLRTEIIVHREARADAAIAVLRGRRMLRPESERELVSQLREHQTVVLTGEEGTLKRQTWPYLFAEIQALGAKSSIVVPWYAGSATFGALVALYSKRTLDQRDVAVLKEIAHSASVAVQRAESLERERRIATTLQQASLPSLLPQPKGLHFDTVYAPAGEEAEVGGDWYDAIELDDGSVVVSVGDVTGRGIQAAAIMSKVRHAMGVAPLHEKNPSKILDSAGWFLGKRYPEAIVTAFVGIISPDRRSMRYANAGHPRPLLRRGGELIELQASGLPLGLRQLFPADGSAAAELRNGDILLVFTDGLIEARREWEIGEGKIRAVAKSELFAASGSPAKLVARACMPKTAHDDVAILTVSVGSAPAWTLYVDDARAAVDARSLFVEFLKRNTNGSDFVESAELVFGELLGNVVRHAPGPVEIAADLGADSLVLHVTDSGRPLSVSDRHLPDDLLSERGRGLFIVSQLAADLRADHVPNCGKHISATIAR
jgi:PAS domain S-box-containing protein